MPKGLQTVRFHAGATDQGTLTEVAGLSPTLRGVGRVRSDDSPKLSFNSDEAAARHYLGNLLSRDVRPAVRSLTAPDRPAAVPDLRLRSIDEVPQTRTRLVRFEQTKSTIPVFGSLAIVELDANRDLISVSAELADLKAISAVATLSPTEALARVSEYIQKPVTKLGDPISPELVFYHDDRSETWHLAYYVRRVQGCTATALAEAHERRSSGHGFGRSPRTEHPRFDYLVDAHDGTILSCFTADPMVAVPTKLQGLDEENRSQVFWGSLAAASGFELVDPIRFIKTYDLALGDIERSAFPADEIANSGADFGNKYRAAVSAHVNATRVYDFFKSVLLRDGIDDKGMDLISAVNCTYSADEPPPQWHNAVWYNDRMWYGQVMQNGELRSYSKYLDVIAHELTHGVTQYTCDLVYQNQSGALNESFSDIFGVTIANWYLVDQKSVGHWNWELGSELGSSGLPLRDMQDPTRTKDPDHMKDYWSTTKDNGGVHTNSNIHNKAAFNFFTSKDAHGNYVFSPAEVATLYYLCLTRLNRTADFVQALRTLLDIARTYYAGDAAELATKSQAITQAYAKVGIT
jgi:bacillolysin/neutral peptidase B